MPVRSADTPFELLERLDRDCLATAKGLPAEDHVPNRWKGILFELAGAALLAPMAEIAEIATPPRLTRVPGAKDWVLGVANMRGTLLPVMDLSGFLFGINSSRDARQQRILVAQNQEFFVGLLVDSVTGLKQYNENQWQASASGAATQHAAVLERFLDGAYGDDQTRYPVFRFVRLAQDEAFTEVQA